MRRLLIAISLAGLTMSVQAQHPGKGLTALDERHVAPDFVLADIDGETHVFTYRGRSVTCIYNSGWKRARIRAAEQYAKDREEAVCWEWH